MLALSLAAMVVAGGCARGSSDAGDEPAEAGGGMTAPRFEDGEGTAAVPTSQVAGGDAIPTGATPTSAGGSTTTAAPGGSSPATPTPRESVAFDDPAGDATPGVSPNPPPWTDLAGASLERQGNAYRLIIRLGGEAPQTAPGAETMNIATFFDTDGDAGVEKELWVNLGRNGWGPVWYDDQGRAAPGEQSNVNLVVQGNEVRLLFPDVMLDKAPKLRFSVASEYGPLTAIGSDTARRDDAPDGDHSVPFP